MPAKNPHLKLLETRVRSLTIPGPLEHGIRAALEEAVTALGEQNFGVGATLARASKAVGVPHGVVGRARNQVFRPRFSSAAHAEMRLLDDLEATLETGSDLVLITTLEPCVMCLARILLSRVRQVVYLAVDRDGGGHGRLDGFPEAFQQLARDLVIEQSDCVEAIALAEDIRDLGGDFVAHVMGQS